ncbi:MAG: (Fe-S)-binding protein, partial [Candidatus Marinimicrobia bacterium]|nr:(Fe-S)-binding protein [Candidatus Neomarinimicrobiota bacterium]
MLSLAERLAFGWLVIICLYYAQIGFGNMLRLIRMGAPENRSDNLFMRFAGALAAVGLQLPLFKSRPIVSIFHAFIFFGFSFYLLVNVNDMAEAYIHGWTILGKDTLLANGFNLFADLFSIFVLVGMIFFLVRRFIARPKVLEFNDNVLLHPDVNAGGIKFDSLFVGIFILLHVGSRWMGTAFALAAEGINDPSLPTANAVAVLLAGLSPEALDLGRHVSWWLAMGLIVLFLPYFPRSKHLHIMTAPVNLALGRKTPKGRMDAVANPQLPGAATLDELPWTQILDAYACIMCTRCHEVCPAHESGTPLSPSALEINKRYLLRSGGALLDDGAPLPNLLQSAISEDAIWACTSCYACVEVCPVGNEPLMDILAMRRRQVFEAKMPEALAEV